MSALSNYAEDKILEHMLNGVVWAAPATVYVSLYTSEPGDDDSGSEVSGFGYARVAMTGGWTNVSGTSTNTALVTFPTASGGSWGILTHFGVHDASSGGNLLVYGALDTPTNIADTNIAEFAAGALSVSMA